jgi:hypothetical protein
MRGLIMNRKTIAETEWLPTADFFKVADFERISGLVQGTSYLVLVRNPEICLPWNNEQKKKKASSHQTP